MVNQVTKRILGLDGKAEPRTQFSEMAGEIRSHNFPDKINEAGERGEMAEWLKARASKACIPLRVSGVRIPLSPPYS